MQHGSVLQFFEDSFTIQKIEMLGREEDILDLFLTDTEVQIGTVTTKSSISYKKLQLCIVRDGFIAHK